MSTTDATVLQTALKPRTCASKDQAKILRAAYKYQFDTFTTKQVLSTLEEQTGLKWIAGWFSRERRKMARWQNAQAQNTAESMSTPTLEVKAELQDTPIKPAAGGSTLHSNDSQAKPKRKPKARKAKRGVPNALVESDPNLHRANEDTSVPALKLIKEEYAECIGSLSSPITIDSTPPPAQQQHPGADSGSSSSSSRPLQNSRAHNILLQTAGLDHEHGANSQPDTRQTSIANVQLALPSITTLLGSLFAEFNLHMHRQNQHMNNQLVENQHPNWGTDSISSRGPGMSLPLQRPSQTDWTLGTGHPNPAYNDSRQLFPCQQSIHPLPQFAPAPSQLHSSPAPPGPAPPPRCPQFDNISTQKKHGFEDILDTRRAPLKHLSVIHDILSAYHRSTNMPFELISGEGQVTPIGHLVIERLTDEALADKDPFQASMGLVFLSRLGLKF
ncbi:hypothetical protein BDN71DRAFT_1510023 [Pleurotus eryngii]|uniref:Homeobox domain-containing protein n=1 Tax=Pleurotus eryngii TaxID=5323 RepID=A0A9P5ZNY7_PLEER|nr:hypothetical protein BDN71DRAFT_1510023 [Pleurotus eryngii]